VSIIVFAGPSLFGVAPPPGIVLRPPASCGDILRAVRCGATTIGLIDGTFEAGAAVWHKEILCALNRGVRVLGAASMGALRAAECAAFGMEGIGHIFEDYRSGRRLADGDVAVLHAPAELGHCPLTVALVDAEATLARLRQSGCVSPALCERLESAAHALHYKGRTWPDIIAHAGLGGPLAAGVAQAIAQFALSVKQADAMMLLARLREPQESLAAGSFELSHTLFLTALEARLGP